MGACKRASLDKTEDKSVQKVEERWGQTRKWRTRPGQTRACPDSLTPGGTSPVSSPQPRQKPAKPLN